LLARAKITTHVKLLESQPLIKSPCRTDFHDAEVDGPPRARRFFDQRTNGITANPLSLEARSQIKLLEKKGVLCSSCLQSADIFGRNAMSSFSVSMIHAISSK
jgi:hypothetical protein